MNNGKFKLIGLTGGVGAGKSTILNYIEKTYKCTVYVTDKIAYDIMRNSPECLEKIKKTFDGDDILNFKGELDSTKIGRVIFSNDAKRKCMNRIVHPRVMQRVLDDSLIVMENGSSDFAIVESALLIECGLASLCDEVWYATADRDVRISRLRNLRHYTRQKCISIINGQLSDEEFRRHSTAVIDTGLKYEETYGIIDGILASYGYAKMQIIHDAKDAVATVAGNMI